MTLTQLLNYYVGNGRRGPAFAFKLLGDGQGNAGSASRDTETVAGSGMLAVLWKGLGPASGLSLTSPISAVHSFVTESVKSVAI